MCSRSGTAARPPTRRISWPTSSAPGRAAIDLTGDPAILTAIANDVGVEAIFSRQVIAYGRPGDALVALSTSGGSANVISALEEARRRGLATIAFVGYDGGRIAAERLADHVVVTRSQHIPRIQEAQASAYHVLCELVVDDLTRAFRGIVGAMAMTGLRRVRAARRADPRGPAERLDAQAGERAAASGAAQAAPDRGRARCTGRWAPCSGSCSGCCRRRSGAARGRARCMACWSGWGSTRWWRRRSGSRERDWPKGRERAVFIADHLLFGLVLSELRSRPRE